MIDLTKLRELAGKATYYESEGKRYTNFTQANVEGMNALWVLLPEIEKELLAGRALREDVMSVIERAEDAKEMYDDILVSCATYDNSTQSL